MSDEPTLPSLPSLLSHAPTSDCSQHVKLQGTSPPVSSDPPLFSSDDDPSAENYSNLAGRRKRKFRGPWFNQQPQELTPAEGVHASKRPFQRQVDSAIWLGSDSSQDDDDANFSSRVQMLSTKEGRPPIVIRPGVGLFHGISRLPLPSHPLPLSPEEIAERIIESYLERVKDRIDLTCLELTTLSNRIIKPLSTFISIPLSRQPVYYRSLRGDMQLFLSSNNLRRIPGEISNLENLVALSLRNNRLVELPAAIGKLRRLTELNAANNHLHYLPYEVLDLFLDSSQLSRLSIHPNPFYEPADAEPSHDVETHSSSPNKDPETLPSSSEITKLVNGGRSWRGKWIVEYKCRSQVRFFEKTGALVKGPTFPRDDSLFTSKSPVKVFYGGLEIPRATPGDTPEPPASSSCVNGREISRVPSLLEVAVKTWSKSQPLPGLDYWREEAPEVLSRLLDDARTLREMEAGDRKCTICSRTFVVPRTEWIEWWEIARKGTTSTVPTSTVSPLRIEEHQRDRTERIVPLIRRGCSWKCVPEAVPLRQEEENGDPNTAYGKQERSGVNTIS